MLRRALGYKSGDHLDALTARNVVSISAAKAASRPAGKWFHVLASATLQRRKVRMTYHGLGSLGKLLRLAHAVDGKGAQPSRRWQ